MGLWGYSRKIQGFLSQYREKAFSSFTLRCLHPSRDLGESGYLRDWQDSSITVFLRTIILGFPSGSAVKNLPDNAKDTGSIPASGRSPGGGNGSPLQYSCPENPMDRGAYCPLGTLWSIGSQRVRHNWKQFSMHTHIILCNLSLKLCTWVSEKLEEAMLQ